MNKLAENILKAAADLDRADRAREIIAEIRQNPAPLSIGWIGSVPDQGLRELCRKVLADAMNERRETILLDADTALTKMGRDAIDTLRELVKREGT